MRALLALPAQDNHARASTPCVGCEKADVKKLHVERVIKAKRTTRKKAPKASRMAFVRAVHIGGLKGA